MATGVRREEVPALLLLLLLGDEAARVGERFRLRVKLGLRSWKRLLLHASGELLEVGRVGAHRSEGLLRQQGAERRRRRRRPSSAHVNVVTNVKGLARGPDRVEAPQAAHGGGSLSLVKAAAERLLRREGHSLVASRCQAA